MGMFPGAALAAAFFVSVAAGMPACAGSFQVNPVRVDLGGANTTAAITLRNDGAEDVVVQMSIRAWSQVNGDDVYMPTTDALVTPPIATIAPGGAQIIRVGLRRRVDPERELAFRLFVQEIPSTTPLPGRMGLRVAVRVGLPVFVAPSSPSRPDLVWTCAASPDGHLKLRVHNRSNVHTKITDIALRERDGADAIARESSLNYVLPGEAREWTLVPDAPSAAAMMRVSTHTDVGDFDADVPVAR